MPDDILDAAQKAINDAAGVIPNEPAPEPMSGSTVLASSIEQPLIVPPPSQQPAPTPDASKLVESILDTGSQATVVSPPPSQQVPPPRKGSPKGVILGILALLLLIIPVGVYYISQTNQQLADVRSKAADFSAYPGCQSGPTYECCTEDPSSCGGNPRACHCQGGNACTGTKCEDTIESFCKADGRSYCNNAYGYGMTCCDKGYSCCTTMNGCCQTGPGPTHTPGPPGNPTNTPPIPTNTPPTMVYECKNLKILKDGVQIAPSTLLPGDSVVLVVKGNGVPTQARFRINGGTWQGSTAAGSAVGEFTLDYTVSGDVTDFIIEAEVFVDGTWK